MGRGGLQRALAGVQEVKTRSPRSGRLLWRRSGGLSNAERKERRGLEAKDAIADHEEAQQVFLENRERLRGTINARAMALRDMAADIVSVLAASFLAEAVL
jgi:hypothetical protein